MQENNSAAEEIQTSLEEKILEHHEEKEKVKRTRKKKVPKSRQEYSANNIRKLLEKQNGLSRQTRTCTSTIGKISQKI